VRPPHSSRPAKGSTSLINAALADTAAAGLEWVCVEAELASAAQRQLLALGLTVAFVRALWTEL
jgi:hypothetical protein